MLLIILGGLGVLFVGISFLSVMSMMVVAKRADRYIYEERHNMKLQHP